MSENPFKSYYKKSRQDRIDVLVDQEHITSDQAEFLKNGQGLPTEIADNMIENALSTYGLPYGLALNFLINDQEIHIPMVTEEPSVIAAASNGGKIIQQAGGFKSQVNQRLMSGQIAFTGLEDDAQALRLEAYVTEFADDLLIVANAAYPSIVGRGGGARSIRSQYYPATDSSASFFIVYLTIDTQEAMGANMMNTMLEALKAHILGQVDFIANIDGLMAILSNYAVEATATASCEITARLLDKGPISGVEVASKIALASQLAQVDVYRATTHNKGIMNGVDAFVLATGNDWRAVEAGVHAYAARDGQYRGLAKWTYDSDREILSGELTLPLALGAVGGSIGIHPTVQVTKSILGQSDAKHLMEIAVSLGLAQNFAAVRALVTEGIQAGHMQLQAKSLAIQAGADGDQEINAVVTALENADHKNLAAAKEILEKLRQE
ncbi:hydroxymethylglutaryl-CoA reductase [Aerococcus sp. 150760007-1]|uniref:3-hydroxy-3-methylglutaryl coenzyme A reductase n=1 Tax=Aerococcus urinaeequi TaxID=51665 RepID=A0ABR5ZXP8_9LACT|nr:MULTISPECIES: hydroxymethylglutaryl-CoA reductase, degradative [Lactobacillales]KAF3301238.1 hydroxymethylglutaryl-CoA reductase, degradative [Carnobacterium sp. PL26RED25]KAF3305430.1 hydroxymethylglutaryl-CoA reductase, degradative [Carnobacterium sp. PL24RED07]KAF3306155.1 hydroxymethylglutaryl-CoA reductase, degradative [Carnobacterium sp. PL17GRE32]MBA5746450.1 hydroxymethylglutaryl-CoA reductase, degradative [Aerococcus urinaeequi]MBA5829234.1 hydroxymethylglutaryl-CoA reductase, degr